MYNLKLKSLGKYDVAVCGGGIAGIGAALAAARAGASVVLIESLSCLGGTVTAGGMLNLMDGENKGGFIRELMTYLTENDYTVSHLAPIFDENGKKRPGRMLDGEATKYYFEKLCTDAGVKILYSSTVAGVDKTDDHINSIFITTYCGNYELSANVYIDASGNGNLGDLADLKWECADPPNPASFGMSVIGVPESFKGTNTRADKLANADRYRESTGKELPSGYLTIRRSPSLHDWLVGYNFEYNVYPDDILRYSEAIIHARAEGFELVQDYRNVPGFEKLQMTGTPMYLGVREGRRFFGEYRITIDDIVSGKRHDDGVCLVTMTVDVHKLHKDDANHPSHGIKSQPYHIPYRSLVPLGCDNMLLAGRCISGDFYPFSSYRVIGNMGTVGEAAGYAAALCSKRGITPTQLDGKEVRRYMEALGHEL